MGGQLRLETLKAEVPLLLQGGSSRAATSSQGAPSDTAQAMTPADAVRAPSHALEGAQLRSTGRAVRGDLGFETVSEEWRKINWDRFLVALEKGDHEEATRALKDGNIVKIEEGVATVASGTAFTLAAGAKLGSQALTVAGRSGAASALARAAPVLGRIGTAAALP